MTKGTPLSVFVIAALLGAVSASACDWDESMKQWMNCDQTQLNNMQKTDPDHFYFGPDGKPQGGAGTSKRTPGDDEKSKQNPQLNAFGKSLGENGAAHVTQPVDHQAGTGLNGVGENMMNGMVMGGRTTGNTSANTNGQMDTQDQIGEEQLLAQLRQQAQAKAKEPGNERFASAIMATYERVAADVRNDKSDKYGANQLEVFGPMLDVQLQEQRDLWNLNRAQRKGDLKPGEFEKSRNEILNRANEAMGKIPSGDVMTYFHNDFQKVWQDSRDKWKDQDAPATGLPGGSHIGGMLDANPKSADTWALSAQDKLAGGDRAGGLSALNRAIDLGGTADAFGMRGTIRADNNDFEGAYRDAVKALELSPGDKNLMGLLKSVEGRVSPQFRASLAAGGAGSAGSAPAGGASYGSGNVGGFATGGFGTGGNRSVAGMTDASTLSSGQKLDEANRALSLGDLQSAESLAQRALEIDPRNAAAHGFLASLYARQGDYKKALVSANAGVALAPRDGALLNKKAFAENRLKQYRDALASSNGAIEANAHDPNAFANRAYAYGGLGDKDSMLSDINRAAAMDSRFQKAAADASALQLPSNADVLFLFPDEETYTGAAPAAAPVQRKSFGLVLGAAALGGLLMALGLLSTVLSPLKDSVVSAFTKATRRGPSLHALEESEPETAAPDAAGLIRGQYEISRQIGAGGMGTVYEGTDRSLGRRVAIKKMRDELRVNARERDRFVIEAKTVASLHHPNIVDIYAIAEEGDDVYLVFEYVDGKTAHDLVQAQGRLAPAEAVRVTQGISDALAYAHAHGVIHRDMKPSNVMLTSDGRVKVMDFGIARMAKDALTRYSMTQNVVGTPPYMAPEQEQGVVRKESDVYSLAICSYEMLTGKLPFIGVSAGMLMNKINMSYIPPSRATAGLPESLDAVFAKAFQADPEQRYRTPQEFSAAFAAAFGGARSSNTPV